jgi:2Fe-2S ferredoxin
MINIVFIKPNGDEVKIEAQEGETLMKAAVGNGVDEILADCGGALSCATCHVHVTPEWMARVGPPSDFEAQMLDMSIEPDEHSRLSCQIRLTPTLDGLKVRLPNSQL